MRSGLQIPLFSRFSPHSFHMGLNFFPFFDFSLFNLVFLPLVLFPLFFLFLMSGQNLVFPNLKEPARIGIKTLTLLAIAPVALHNVEIGYGIAVLVQIH